MQNPPIVSIVGRPNVGKSSLFNRFLNQRVAVTDGQPGVTRDRLYRTMEWNGKRFTLVDTGGMTVRPRTGIDTQVNEQIRLALAESAQILFIVDGTTGITQEDLSFARELKRQGKPVLLVVNKIDNQQQEDNRHIFHRLGLGEPYPISALHGRNAADLLDRLCDGLPAA